MFSRTGYHLKAKILEQSEKIFFLATSPYKFKSCTPPPGPPFLCVHTDLPDNKNAAKNPHSCNPLLNSGAFLKTSVFVGSH